MYSLGYRPVMIQRIELGANARVTLDAIMHEAIHVAIRGLPSARDGVVRLAPKAPMRSTRTSARELDLATSCDMRGPSATTGVYALECAKDELAVALKIDPLDLRFRCYSDLDPEQRRAAVQQNLRECYRQGATQGRQAVQRCCLFRETALARLRRELRHSGRGGSGFTPL